MFGLTGLLMSLLLVGCAGRVRSGIEQRGNFLHSAEAPTLSLEIGNGFMPLSPLRFPIGNLTDVDRRIFVEADADRVVRRLVIVQFEKAQPGTDFRFRYPAKPPMQFGADVYRFGAYAYDDVRAAAASPGKEAALTRDFLRDKGYTPARLMRVARLARVSDPQGLSEAIVFYMENADRDYPPGPLAGADEDGDAALDEAAAAGIFARLRSAIRVVAH
jgi:hypothetical protein